MTAAPWPYGPRCNICVSLAESSPALLLERSARLQGADLVEIRLDALDAEHAPSPAFLAEMVSRFPLPVGFTLRPRWQGGAYRGDEAGRREVLEQAARAGAGFVDVELDAEWAADFVAASPCPVVVSHHWEHPAADVRERVERARGMSPAMIKLVGTAAAPDDAVELLEAGRELVGSGQPATCFCMGEAGKASRLLAAAQGASLIYAAAESGREVAPGQWPLRCLVDELGVPGWRHGAELCGLIGHPIGHSLSPAIFNAVFRERDENMIYLPVPGDDLDAVLRLIGDTGFRGVSVTMPFKEQMAARSETREALVEATGAANTVVFDAAGWTAINTDGQAVVDALAQLRSPTDARVALVGAGGAARAAAVALVSAAAQVTVLNRTRQRAEQVGAITGASCGPVETLQEEHFDVIINATPVGMTGTPAAGATPFPTSWLHGDEVVFDMVYRPRSTPLLRQAAALGCTVIEGLEMFVRQAAAQYGHLTGGRDDGTLASMRATATRILGDDMPDAHNPSPDGTARM